MEATLLTKHNGEATITLREEEWNVRVYRREMRAKSCYNRLDTGPVILGRAPACKGAYGVVRLTNFIRPGKLLSDQWSGWELAWWTLGLFISPAVLLSLSLFLSLPLSLKLNLSFDQFEFLVLVLGLGHSFSSPTFALRCFLVKMNWSLFLCASLCI